MKHGARRPAVLLLLGALPAISSEPEARILTDYVRLVRHQKGREDPGRWIGQTSVRELRHPRTGVVVVLLSLAHVGTKDYYAGMASHLRDAEAVLAEGTGGLLAARAKDEELPPDALWIRRFTTAYARLLGLVEQADWEASAVDARWVLADMDREKLLQAMATNGFSFPDEAKPVVERWEALLRGPSSAAADMSRAREEAAGNLLRLFHEGAAMSEGEANVHHAREEIAWRIISQKLAAGKLKRVAILYGAWHASFLEAKLVTDLGFRVEATCWQDALVVEKA